MADNATLPAVAHEGVTYLYSDLLRIKAQAQCFLDQQGVQQGQMAALCADYSPASLAMLLALIEREAIVVPISIGMETGGSQYIDIADPEYIIAVVGDGYDLQQRTPERPKHELVRDLAGRSVPGLVLFTSGTTGTPKAVLHDLNKLLSKFIRADKRHRALCFLMFDHIGGVDTYFYSLFSGGLAVFPGSRDPAHICKLVETHKVEVMPVSPTFLNLLLLSGAHKLSDLSSLQIITFGAEKISDSLLERVEREFSPVRLVQKYGITELGSPSSRTHREDSSLIKVAGDSVKVKVVDGILHVKADTAMIGYLNAASPFTEDGWYNTGDAAEEHGDYIKILGRVSDMINVGGEKVFPAEVESAILEMDAVADVLVYGEENPLVGQMVCARVNLTPWADSRDIVQQVKSHCGLRLEKHKIPAKVTLSEESLHGERYKKLSASAH